MDKEKDLILLKKEGIPFANLSLLPETNIIAGANLLLLCFELERVGEEGELKPALKLKN